jgi:hypothetical protein
MEVIRDCSEKRNGDRCHRRELSREIAYDLSAATYPSEISGLSPPSSCSKDDLRHQVCHATIVRKVVSSSVTSRG